MDIILLLIPAAIALLVFFRRRGFGGSFGRRFTPPEVSPISRADLSAFEAAPSLFVNGAEAALFHCLKQVLPAGFHLHSKVRLEDIIRVKRGVPQKARWAARGRVKSRHVDFLITASSGKIIMAIELDGRAHNPKNPSEADKVKTALFRAAAISLRRIRVGEDFHHIAATIAAELQRNYRPG